MQKRERKYERTVKSEGGGGEVRGGGGRSSYPRQQCEAPTRYLDRKEVLERYEISMGNFADYGKLSYIIMELVITAFTSKALWLS